MRYTLLSYEVQQTDVTDRVTGVGNNKSAVSAVVPHWSDSGPQLPVIRLSCCPGSRLPRNPRNFGGKRFKPPHSLLQACRLLFRLCSLETGLVSCQRLDQ